jgi:uncharacterized membrane protein YuzA (DUF378 family)
MSQVYIMIGVVAVLLLVQLFLRYKVKKQKEERENRRFGK